MNDLDQAGARTLGDAFGALFDGICAIGRDPAGGWSRFAWTPEDAAARAWFATEATLRGLTVELDSAGNQWAWWPAPGGSRAGAVVTGSHLDTVPSGGAYDGALGVVAGLLAVDELRARGVVPARPLAVVAFADEEGARFNLPTFGSRVLSGQLDIATVLDRRDATGRTLAEALAAAGMPHPRPDTQLLAQVSAFVELHVEQGRGLVDHGVAVGVGSGIWPHGRWRLDVTGEPNHAGTTRMADRRDPMAVLAAAIETARELATEYDAVATVGRVVVRPNGSNAVPGSVTAWLDARASDHSQLEQLVQGFENEVAETADRHRVDVRMEQESFTAAVQFDPELTGRIARTVAALGQPAVTLPTAAGHDAGILSAVVPATMLFVRNPTGVSHSPEEHADPADCLAGVRALAAVLEELAGRA